MKFTNWLGSYRSKNHRALSLYKRGMTKARKRDHEGAMEDYNSSIGMLDASSDTMALVLYHRALVHAAVGDEPRGVDDLEAVLALDDAPVNICTMARLKLARMEFVIASKTAKAAREALQKKGRHPKCDDPS